MYYKNSPTSILFSRVGKRWFFPKKNALIMKIKLIKNKTWSKKCFLIQFHILCAHFRKIGRKKNKNLGDDPLKVGEGLRYFLQRRILSRVKSVGSYVEGSCMKGQRCPRWSMDLLLGAYGCESVTGSKFWNEVSQEIMRNEKVKF